ncbi:hypothetical protein WA158_003755 [Blastocystis sp. Blastoise]
MSIIESTYNYGVNVLTKRSYFWHFFIYVILAETILGLAIIHFVPYTEIDWKAYMQEVYGAMYETLDYTKLKGDTGPLVYPAGFVWIFEWLYKITDNGENIRLAQYIFLGIYILNQMMTIYLYHKSERIPQYVSLFLCISKRMKSIYMLRCFNDTVTLNITLVALLLFTNQQWFLGMLVYAFACSTKMNALLYAPGLLLILFESVGPLYSILLFVLLFVFQGVIAIPFLKVNAWGYLSKAYEFGRVFTYKWTVNFKFLSEEVFVNKYLGLSLLILQLVLLLLFIFCKWSKQLGGVFNTMKSDMSAPYKSNIFAIIRDWFIPRKVFNKLTTDHILLVLFGSNFIGILCSRSIHYQYYSWYFYTIPYLLYREQMPSIIKMLLFFVLEYSYNVYPSTPLSSILLQITHILITLYMATIKMGSPIIKENSSSNKYLNMYREKQNHLRKQKHD